MGAEIVKVSRQSLVHRHISVVISVIIIPDSSSSMSSITGLPKTIIVHGYFRANGTYVRGYYRSK